MLLFLILVFLKAMFGWLVFLWDKVKKLYFRNMKWVRLWMDVFCEVKYYWMKFERKTNNIYVSKYIQYGFKNKSTAQRK